VFISHYIHLVVKNVVFIAVLADELFDRKMLFFFPPSTSKALWKGGRRAVSENVMYWVLTPAPQKKPCVLYLNIVFLKNSEFICTFLSTGRV